MRRLVTQSGFTLVELMVSLTIFSIVMLVSVGTLLVLIDANAKAQALSSAMTNLTFAIDSMTRTIRTGRNYHCTASNLIGSSLPADSSIQDCTGGNTAIVFTPGMDSTTRIAYRLNNSAIEQRIDRGATAGPWVPITSNVAPVQVTVDTLRFIVEGIQNTDASNYVQPTVNYVIGGSVQNGLDGEATIFKIQSRTTQRILNF